MKNKTHWKKAFKSNYLSSSDIDDKDLILTIEKVVYKECMTQSGKKFCNVAIFKEQEFKPMILNVGNSKIVKNFSGNKTHLEDWSNIKVQIYVDHKVRFGSDTVEGLRIRKTPPKNQNNLPQITDKNFANAVQFLKSGKTITELKTLRNFDQTMQEKLILEASL